MFCSVTVHFRVLDVQLDLAGPATILSPIAAAYERFRTSSSGESGAIGDRQDAVVLNGRPVPLLPGFDPVLVVYQQFLTEIQTQLASKALLHGASLVDADGRVLLLAAPAAHGKTSLTLELLTRGFRFLSDDYSPFDLATGVVHPYPRATAIDLGGLARIPAPFREAASAPGAPRLLGKAVVDVGRVLGEDIIAASPARLSRVVLLTATDPREPAAPPHTLLTVAGVVGARARLERQIAAVEGVRITARDVRGSLFACQIELDHQRLPSASLAPILDDPAVLFVERCAPRAPDFEGPPSAAPVARREAAVHLAQEMLNRRGGSRLVAGRRGGVTELFLELAAALAGASCWRVRPGSLGETADLVQRLGSAGA